MCHCFQQPVAKLTIVNVDLCANVMHYFALFFHSYIGMRVNNVYDIDNKTYLIRLQK